MNSQKLSILTLLANLTIQIKNDLLNTKIQQTKTTRRLIIRSLQEAIHAK